MGNRKIITVFFVSLFITLLLFFSNDVNAQNNLELSIPNWIRTNAGWWVDGQISDDDFVRGVEFMIENQIIHSPSLSVVEAVQPTERVYQPVVVPQWIKNNAEWWEQGLISDDDFANGIHHLVKKRIISSPRIVIVEVPQIPFEPRAEPLIPRPPFDPDIPLPDLPFDPANIPYEDSLFKKLALYPLDYCKTRYCVKIEFDKRIYNPSDTFKVTIYHPQATPLGDIISGTFITFRLIAQDSQGNVIVDKNFKADRNSASGIYEFESIWIENPFTGLVRPGFLQNFINDQAGSLTAIIDYTNEDGAKTVEATAVVKDDSLRFDKNQYRIDQPINITAVSTVLNINHDERDTIYFTTLVVTNPDGRVTSVIPPIYLIETGPDTGVFSDIICPGKYTTNDGDKISGYFGNSVEVTIRNPSGFTMITSDSDNGETLRFNKDTYTTWDSFNIIYNGPGRIVEVDLKGCYAHSWSKITLSGIVLGGGPITNWECTPVLWHSEHSGGMLFVKYKDLRIMAPVEAVEFSPLRSPCSSLDEDEPWYTIDFYGKYCGPGLGDDTYTTPPDDAVDRVCMIHDACYGDRGYFDCRCDRELLRSLPQAIANSDEEGQEYGLYIYTIFSNMPCTCHIEIGGLNVPYAPGLGGVGAC